MEPTIRPLKREEQPLLEAFLYQAIFQRDTQNMLPRSIIYQPDIWVYIKEYGKPDDHCLLAELDSQIAGAVWARILSGPVKGFGNIDEHTPEFAISLYPGFRGQGIGTRLMQAMLQLLREKGYPKASLAVQKDNYAVTLYQKVGFSILRETEEEYIMVVQLQAN